MFAQLLLLCKASVKNVKLYIYLLLQMGDRKKAKQICDEYMIKVCLVCTIHFFLTSCIETLAESTVPCALSNALDI